MPYTDHKPSLSNMESFKIKITSKEDILAALQNEEVSKWEDTTFGKVLMAFIREWKGKEGQAPCEWILKSKKDVYNILLKFGIKRGILQTDELKAQ